MIMRLLPRLVHALWLLGSISLAQVSPAANDDAGRLLLQGTDRSSPNTVYLLPPSQLRVTIGGNPQRPFVLVHAAGISVAAATTPSISVDVGPAATATALLNGINGSTFFDQLANTGAGEVEFSLPIPGTIPPGSAGAFQAFVVDFTVPGFVADTAATELVIATPPDFGTVRYGRGTTASSLVLIETSASGGAGAVAGGFVGFDFQILSLVAQAELNSTAVPPGDLRRRQPPTAASPRFDAANGAFSRIRTVWGDLHHFEDTLTGEFGFLIADSGAPIVLPGSRRTNFGSAISAWSPEVALDGTSTTLAAVANPALGGDTVHLFRLDGSTFAQTGTGTIDVTPLAANATINDESLTFSGGALYFVDGPFQGTLYRVPAGGPGPATPVILPPLGTGATPAIVDRELFRHEPTGDVYVRAANAAGTAWDVFRLSAISATGETITNVSSFTAPTIVGAFGDGHTGTDGRIAVSPSGGRVAFVTGALGAEDLYVAPADGSSAPVLVTGPTRFAAAIDNVIDLNHCEDGHVLFFAGTTSTATDLYRYTLATGSLTNLTATNGQSGATPILPIPPATIAPMGYVGLTDRMVFGRGGFLGGAPVLNLVGVVYAGPTLYNVTGDEFPGASTANCVESFLANLELGFAAQSDLIWFSSALQTSAADELWVFDAHATAPATRVTFNGGAVGVYDNLSPDSSGATLVASWRPTGTVGDEELVMVGVGTVGAEPLTDDGLPSSDVTDGSIVWLDAAGPVDGFIFAQGTNEAANPTDARLNVFDLTTRLASPVDPTPGAYWVFALSYP